MRPTAPFLMTLTLLFASVFSAASLAAEPTKRSIDATRLKDWITAHQEVETLHATFTQTRKLLTVRNPLKADGELTYQAPSLFRWELGEPPKTIVVHDGETVTILHIDHKKAQVVAPSDEEDSPGSFLHMAFPQSWEEFTAAFDFLAYDEVETMLTVKVTPKDEKLSKDIKSIEFVIETTENQLRQFNVNMKIGTAIVTEFNEINEGVELAEGVFEVSLDGYEIEEGN